jgi:hypothetical protein
MSARLARPAAAVAVVVLLIGTLAGCGGDHAAPKRTSTADQPVKTLAAGTCWGDQQLPEVLGSKAFSAWVDKYARGDSTLGDAMRDDAAFTEEVDCSVAHSLELYNVVELTPELTGRITEYADLLDQKSALYHLVRDQVNDRCMAGSAYGQAQRRAGGLPVQLGPSLNVDGGLHVAWDPFPADLWAKGQKKFVCTFEQDDPGTLRFADVATSKVPIKARVCLNTPGKYLPCSSRHQAEDIAEMVLNTAIEKGQIDGKKAVRTGAKGPYVALSDAEYARLDKICQTLLTSVSTVRGGVVGRAYPGSVSQWPSDSGAYVASCFALKPFDPPPPTKGTVFNRP